MGEFISKSSNIDTVNYVNKNYELALCRDICTGLKHLTIRSHKCDVSDPHTKIVFEERMTASFQKVEMNGIQIVPIIVDLENKINLVNIAHLCIDKWNIFLKENNICKSNNFDT